MATDNDLDFLDAIDFDEVADPEVNTAPLYRRVHEGFFAGQGTLARAEYRSGEYDNVEIYYTVPEADNDGNDVIQLKWGFPKARKPAAIALGKMGVPLKNLKAFLAKPNKETFDKNILPALTKAGTANILQIPGRVKGKGGKRYPQQEVYSEKAWAALLAKYGGEIPSAEIFGVTDSPAEVDANDDPYDV